MTIKFRRSEYYAVPMLALVYFGIVALLLRGGGRFYFGPEISDLTYTFYPWRSFLSRWLGRGVYPFWDPHVFSGYPVLEMQQMGLFNPVSIISAMLLPPRLSLHAMTAAHVAIALFGTYAAMRAVLRYSKTAAAIGATAFVLGTLFSIRVAAGHFTVVAALAFSPLAIIVGYGAVALLPVSQGNLKSLVISHTSLLPRCPQLRQYLVLTAVCNAATVFVGSPQYVVYLFYAQAAGWLLAFPRRWFGVFSTLGLTWTIAAALSCPQWFPTFFYLPFTGRGSGSSMMSPGGVDKLNLLLETLLPYPFGDDLSVTHLHLKSIWETGNYPGALALVLTVAILLQGALRRKIRPRGRLGIGVLLIGVYLCIGGWLPGLSSFREALKARSIISIGFAFIVAEGVRQLTLLGVRRLQHKRLIHAYVVSAVAFAAFAATAGIYAHTQPDKIRELIQNFGAPFDPVGQPFYQEVQKNPKLAGSMIVKAALHLGICCAVIGVTLLLRRRWMLAALFAIVITDLGVTNYLCYLSRHPFDAVEFPTALRENIVDEIRNSGERRWRVSLPPELSNRSHLVDGIYETGGYDPIMPRNANNHAALIGQSSKHDQQSSITVALAIGRRIDFSKLDYRSISSTEAASIPRVEGAVLATLERKVAAGIPSDMAFGPSVDGTHYIVPKGSGQMRIIEAREPPKAFRREVQSAAETTTTTNDVLEEHPVETPNAYSYTASLSAPAYLVVRTTWLPGWNVRINDKPPRKPYCANGWMLALYLAAGTHNIEFYYRPVGILPALVVSGETCLLLLAWVYLPMRRNRNCIASAPRAGEETT